MLLPLGSVVYLKNADHPLMIVERYPIIMEKEKTIYSDYMGCPVPSGLLRGAHYYFNDENIERIIHKGFCDLDETFFEEIDNEMKTLNLEKANIEALIEQEDSISKTNDSSNQSLVDILFNNA